MQVAIKGGFQEFLPVLGKSFEKAIEAVAATGKGTEILRHSGYFLPEFVAVPLQAGVI